jgi:hypoxanthine phosphoribosyltransferase
VLEQADKVCSAAEISRAITRMAGEISAALADAFPLVLCVMRGGVVFAGQLLPQLRFPLELDYLDVSRYGDATRGGDLAWRVEPGEAVAGRVVLVVDDVLDEGRTLAAIREKLESLGAARVICAVLAVKAVGRPGARPDFVGVSLPDRYLFGFGMDVRGAWRNLPEIYALRDGEA